MAELSYEKLQARAIHSAEHAYQAAVNNRPDAAGALQAQAQVEALLAVGAAMKELTRALRAGK
ncbi:hypothetical protein ELQ39_28175 [Streptomyces sp. GB4-14]|uniref:hypothetical protein n=1 Tax=Streptomyces sp. GB4-14 TaxID=2498703 RepID=UPI001F5EBE8E|nr:hypothetical protein [Streptomyces sp. GB4-14]